MKNKKIIIICAVIAVVVIALVLGIVNFSKNQELNYKENLENSNNSESMKDPEDLSDLELTGEKYETSEIYAEDNTKVNLSDFSDKPMALLFFNTSELDSYEVIRILQKNYDNYKEEINFVNIAVIDGVTETKEDINNNIKANSITMPILYDTDYSAKNEYEINKIPTLVFINKNNEIINTVSEDINEDVIQANLDILAENY